jgi:diguanylate cyclase (GGDEF)-like protein
VLNQNLRAADFAARIGGDEFAIVLLGMPHEEARDWFERIRVAFHHVYDGAGISTVACSLSGGFAFVEAATDDANTVLARADAALYEAKREGRDRVIEKLAS